MNIREVQARRRVLRADTIDDVRWALFALQPIETPEGVVVRWGEIMALLDRMKAEA